MSNQITVYPTKFEDPRTGTVDYGFRISDTEGAVYVDTLESVPDDDLELIAEVISCRNDNGNLMSMMDHIEEHHLSITVSGSDTYTWDKIAHLFG